MTSWFSQISWWLLTYSGCLQFQGLGIPFLVICLCAYPSRNSNQAAFLCTCGHCCSFTTRWQPKSSFAINPPLVYCHCFCSRGSPILSLSCLNLMYYSGWTAWMPKNSSLSMQAPAWAKTSSNASSIFFNLCSGSSRFYLAFGLTMKGSVLSSKATTWCLLLLPPSIQWFSLSCCLGLSKGWDEHSLDLLQHNARFAPRAHILLRQ